MDPFITIPIKLHFSGAVTVGPHVARNKDELWAILQKQLLSSPKFDKFTVEPPRIPQEVTEWLKTNKVTKVSPSGKIQRDLSGILERVKILIQKEKVL